MSLLEKDIHNITELSAGLERRQQPLRRVEADLLVGGTGGFLSGGLVASIKYAVEGNMTMMFASGVVLTGGMLLSTIGASGIGSLTERFIKFTPQEKVLFETLTSAIRRKHRDGNPPSAPPLEPSGVPSRPGGPYSPALEAKVEVPLPKT